MNPAAPPTTTDDDPGNPSVDFRGEKRSNETHRSIIDPEAMLMRKGKGKEAKLVIMGHALMGNRHGLLIDFQVTQATRTAERDMVSKLLDQAKDRRFDPKTLGGDKRYDTGDCADDMRDRRVAPHVAPNTSNRRSAIDGRTTRHPGYAVSQRIRKRVEERFGWIKTVGGFRRTRYLGLDRTGLAGYMVATAHNPVGLSRLVARQSTIPAAARPITACSAERQWNGAKSDPLRAAEAHPRSSPRARGDRRTFTSSHHVPDRRSNEGSSAPC
jgi:hypothetical protein